MSVGTVWVTVLLPVYPWAFRFSLGILFIMVLIIISLTPPHTVITHQSQQTSLTSLTVPRESD